MKNLIGKTVTLYVYDNYIVRGTLTNHKPDLFQVTESADKHFVFWDFEIETIQGNNLYHKMYLN